MKKLIILCLVIFIHNRVDGQSVSSTAYSPTNITATTVDVRGFAQTYASLYQIYSVGFCWSTISPPKAEQSLNSWYKTLPYKDGSSFYLTIQDLKPNTVYYYSAFAYSNYGYVYSDYFSFRTLPASPPILSTNPPYSTTRYSATSGGNISSDGSEAVTARGVCWSTTANPTIANSKTTDGIGTGGFTSSITGLSIGTTYHIRAYATNSLGTGYGNDFSFTISITTPTLTTTIASSITGTTAISGGNISSDGADAVTARGICWSTTANPTISNSKTTDGVGTGTFVSAITGLSPMTTYYVRAYATNSVGTSYGSNIYLTTLSMPALTTTAASYITGTTATSGGNVTSDVGATVTARGVCWSTTTNPTISDSKTSNGTGTGSFTSSITGLAQGTTYHVRAYATSSGGTSYGSDISFTTLSTPTLTTAAVSDISEGIAYSGGNVTNSGGTIVTAAGVCWSATANPTINNNKTTDWAGTGTFTSYITGLTRGTTYHVRAYATNSVGTAYGSDLSFTTPTTPTITTTAASSITGTAAISGGNISSTGGSTNGYNLVVWSCGVCWSTTANPTISDSKILDSTGYDTATSFTSIITGLLPNTTYHIRAYATNSIGTAYGSDLTFTTLNNTALNDNSVELFNVYPNPTNGIFTLNMESNSENNSTACLLNTLGQKVYEVKLGSNKSTLNLNDYNFKGIYFLLLHNEKGILLGERKIIFK